MFRANNSNSLIGGPHLSRGQATISLVFLIGGIIIVIGVSMAYLVISFINSGSGFQSANQALAAASAGADDAIMQINRNKDFASTGYTVQVNGNSASVSVSQNTPEAGQITILSESTVSRRKKKIQVIMSINSSTGQADMRSWQEIIL